MLYTSFVLLFTTTKQFTIKYVFENSLSWALYKIKIGIEGEIKEKLSIAFT